MPGFTVVALTYVASLYLPFPPLLSRRASDAIKKSQKNRKMQKLTKRRVSFWGFFCLEKNQNSSLGASVVTLLQIMLVNM